MSDDGIPTGEFIALLDALCNNQMTDADCTRLQEILRENPIARRLYFAYLDLHLGIRQAIAVETAKDGLPWNAPDGNTVPPKPQKFLGSRLRTLIACAVIVVGVVGLLLRNHQDGFPLEESLTISRVLGNVRIVDGHGRSRPASNGESLLSKERIETGTGESFVRLTYADGTWLMLLNDSAMTREGAREKKLVVHRGVVSANVAPQPEIHPMQLSTPEARIEVVGTRFALAASPEVTELNVVEGRVRVTRVSNGQTVDVIQGQSLVTNGDVELAVRELVPPHAEWKADFEGGVPKGWTGSLVKEKLPKGSQGAIQAIRDDQSTSPVVYSLATRKQWVEGLFPIQEKTHLHITLKMERPNWLNVFFTSRNADASQPDWALHIFNEVPFGKFPPGEWRTLTIPLTKFRRKRNGVFRDEPPQVGEVVYELSLSFIEEDRGLVVDRIWTTRTGSGVVELVPVD